MDIPRALPAAGLPALLAHVAAALAGAARPEVTLPAAIAARPLVELALRGRGRLLHRQWARGADLADALAHGLGQARAALAAQGLTAETVEITLPRDWRPLSPQDLTRSRCNLIRGICGLELRGPGRLERIGPLEMLARNLGPKAALKQLAARLPAGATEAWLFSADQILIELSARRARPLLRGQPVVPQAAITRAKVEEMAALMTGWMAGAVAPNGRAVYKYWPSSGQYALSNNMIRQFMGSACLARAAQRPGAPAELRAICARNIRHNLAAWYRDEGAFGVIVEGPKVKLGAAAVAAMALLDLGDPAHAAPLSGLRAFLEAMQHPTGRFACFLRPPGREEDCQNFYPGEALLALMRLWQVSRDPALLDRVAAGFAHYRDWHRAHRNPAFVPWHSMALCLFHAATGRQDAADFVFEMNDWLLGLQQGGDAPADVQGEFFDPARPGFGPPHASATGVYLEGLVEAFALARTLGDTARAEAYRRAILGGLRSLRQLQFRHASDMFYIGNRKAVLGGLRSSGFDNTLRIDNVQHGLMAIFRILELFSEQDFQMRGAAAPPIASPRALP